MLATIPGKRIFEVQPADATRAVRGALLTEDLMRYRLFAREGEFDIAGVVGVLRSIGGYRSVGAEVFSDATDALDALDAGRRAGRNLSAWL